MLNSLFFVKYFYVFKVYNILYIIHFHGEAPFKMYIVFGVPSIKHCFDSYSV